MVIQKFHGEVGLERRKGYARLIFFASLLFFVVPKYNLIQVGSLTSGLRVDDLISLLFFVILIKFFFNIRGKGEIMFMIFLLFAFASSLISIILFENYVGILFPVRWFEYFVFFIVGVYFFERGLSIKPILVTLFAAQLIVGVLQFQGFLGAISSSYGVVAEAPRVMGLTGGPWELAPYITLIMLSLCFEYIKQKKNFNVFLVFSLGLILVFFTSSRIGLLAYVLSFVFLIALLSRRLLFFFVLSLPIFFILGFAFSERLLERSSGLMNLEANIGFVVEFYNQVKPFSSLDYVGGYYAEGDLSWQIRIYKWVIAIKSFLTLPFFTLFGVGSGMWGSALDGGWVRVLTENGLIGLILFTLPFIYWAKSAILKSLVFVMFLNMVFIDINYASKFMSLLFFLIGYFLTLERSVCVYSK